MVTVDGVNDELGPWLQMTVPPELGDDLDIERVPLGQPLGRSWVKLFGWLPVEYDDIRLVEREPGRRFQEDSTMFALARWRHERTVEPAGERACEVTDRLQFSLRPSIAWIPGSARLVATIVRALFEHRHARLRARFR